MTDTGVNTDLLKGGIVLIDKPYRWTSFDAVNKVRSVLRRYYGIKKIKVGHAGTLDPLATGLVIICTGKMTKDIHRFQSLEKEYIANLHLGKTTPSFDLETSSMKHRILQKSLSGRSWRSLREKQTRYLLSILQNLSTEREHINTPARGLIWSYPHQGLT